MAMTKRVTRNQNHHDASSSKTIKTNDVGPFSYLNHDVLSLVTMKLGVVDFLAFSGVCKSWSSVALSNKKRFMESKPPMLMCISTRHNNDKECCLEDSEGRKFKTVLTHSAGICCVGLASGYLIFFRKKTKDFWLVNPITRHELSFPPAPCVSDHVSEVTSVLVFSPSISKFVFVMLATRQIWFSIEDEGAWNCVSTFDIGFKDLHVFKGRIYIISCRGHFCELTLKPHEPKLTLLKTKNLLDENLFHPELVSWGENLYVIAGILVGDLFKVYKLDFGEMEWVPFQDEHAFAFFLSVLSHSAVVEPESWADPLSQDGIYNVTDVNGHGIFFTEKQWYFPHECLNVNLIDES